MKLWKVEGVEGRLEDLDDVFLWDGYVCCQNVIDECVDDCKDYYIA